jgi:transketolase N-terminal domain/subunit
MQETLRQYHIRTGASHYHSAKSVLPILIDIKAKMVDGDVCILSKAHAVTAFKLVFEELPEEPPVPDPFTALGLALPFALGVAMERPDNTIYVVLGDGEMQEGMNLEAMFAMERLGIKNVQVLVDWNGMQGMRDTPPLIFPVTQFEWVKTYKGESWDCHYENAK